MKHYTILEKRLYLEHAPESSFKVIGLYRSLKKAKEAMRCLIEERKQSLTRRRELFEEYSQGNTIVGLHEYYDEISPEAFRYELELFEI